MSQNLAHAIEFFGGPLDGHVEFFSADVCRLPEHLLCYISENTFRQLEGREELRRVDVTSLAVYTRLLHRRKWVYWFVTAEAPNQISIQPGSNDV
jgi:hypothetical protein